MTDEHKEPMPEKLTKKSLNMPRWYTDVIRMAKLADYAPVKGCMVIMPYGFSLWENIRDALDARIKDTGHVNAYFPLLIPESFLQKEAEHVEGFAPEVAWVTHGGHDELEERLAIRPTSEAMICHMYSKWIRSWRDLPVLINQWANILRWEMVTRLFLRTTEFLWQEGHTAHATAEEAEDEALKMLAVYKRFAEEHLAMPVLVGRKSEAERFAGALYTYTIEALMSDGKALQAGTSHHLGQHFAKAFDIKFLDKDEKEKYVWQTSWGVSTRLIGGVVMMHGDDAGLILPPMIAPVQAIVVPIWDDASKEKVRSKALAVLDALSGVCRAEADMRDEYRPGWKFNEHELRGVPLRIEIGPKDVEKGQVVMVRRDTREKNAVPIDKVNVEARVLLDKIQTDLFKRADAFRQEHTFRVSSLDDMKKRFEKERGFFDTHWCEGASCETEVKERTKATVRCIPFDEDQSKGSCLVCGKQGVRTFFARSY